MDDDLTHVSYIPAKVRYDYRISSGAKLLYSEILVLVSKYGFCWASNIHLARLYHVEGRTIRRWLSELKKYRYIKIALLAKNKRRIYINTNKYQKILDNANGQVYAYQT